MEMVIKLSLQKYMLYFNTLKYLKVSQFYHRGSFLIKKKAIFKSKMWKKSFSGNVENHYSTMTSLNLIDFTNENYNISSIDYDYVQKQKKLLVNKEFEFLNKKVIFSDELGWNDTNLSQLWKYNLHYFDYFRRLIELETILADKENYQLLKEYVESWIRHNGKIGIGDGWHSYTISLRLVNWILAYSAFSNYIQIDKKFQEKFLRSIVMQSNFLLKNREYDVVGNHLFENLKTLIICGMFLGDSTLGVKCKDIGERELLKQLSEQFLYDGGHFELSAMYHSILLKGLTELIHVYNKLGFTAPSEFFKVQKKAIRYLKNIIHPDGEIPLFNDAAFGIADSPLTIFEYASEENFETSKLCLFDKLLKSIDNTMKNEEVFNSNATFYASDSGYLRTSDEKMFSILDVGKPCPDYLPAHAHADIFSYELSYKGNRLVVDTGTYEYAGTKRNYDRATHSHNTVTINNENQSQVWGSFRVAERAIPTVQSFTGNDDYTEIFASHDGYMKKFGTLHFNEVIIVLDSVNSKEEVNSYVHFNPSINISLQNDSLYISGEKLVIKPINAIFSIEESVYHPRFGVEINSRKLNIQPKKPGVFGYYYSFGNSEIIIDNNEITLRKENKTISIDIRLEQ
jgi:uncharacterized heparinase superfamily protein